MNAHLEPRTSLALATLLLFVLACTFNSAGAQPARQIITEGDNVYAAGGDARINSATAGDIVVAGGRVTVEQAVGGDAWLAGGAVDVRAPIKGDLRAVGGSVNIDGNVSGEVMVGGGQVSVGKNTIITGQSRLAGSSVTISGNLARGAQVYAQTVTIDGKLEGDVAITAERINLQPNSQITGNLTYSSANELSRAPDSVIRGDITRTEWQPNHPNQRSRTWDRPGHWWSMLVYIPLFILAALWVAGALLVLVFPNVARGVVDTLNAEPLKSFGLGALLSFALPPLTVFLFLTMIGIPLGFIAIATLATLALVGYLVCALWVAERLTRRAPQETHEATTHESTMRRLLVLTLGLVVLVVVAIVPIIGWVINMLAALAGMGAWGIWLYRRYRGGTPTALPGPSHIGRPSLA
jgi:cytoskeletal protein CcmA (bactofilin family)